MNSLLKPEYDRLKFTSRPFSHYPAFFTAAALAALPVAVFNGRGWYPPVDFYKWTLVFFVVAYGVGAAAFSSLRETGVQVTRMELAWLVLVMLAGLQPFFVPLRSLHEWLRNLYFFAALGGAVIVLRNLPIDGVLPGILRAVAATGGLSVIFGCVQNFLPDLRLPFILDASGASDRFLGNTVLDNILGAYLALAAVAGLWLLLYGPRGRGRFCAAIRGYDFFVWVLSAVGLWKTGSRSAFIACFIGLFVLWAACGFVFAKKNLKLLLTAVLLVACVAFAAPEVLRVERRDMSKLLNLDGFSAKYEGRWAIWLTSWEMIKNAPMLGTGLGNFKWNYLDALAAFREKYDLEPRYTFWAHNEYLQWIAETGIVGGALFFSLLLYGAGLGLRGLKRARNGHDREKVSLLSWSMAALAVLMADSCFSRPMHHVDTAFTLPLALGMISRLEASPLRLSFRSRAAVSGAIIVLSLSGIIFLTQSFQGRRYLGKYFYEPFYLSTRSSRERESRKPPFLIEDAFLRLTARENYNRTLIPLEDAEQNDRDALRLLRRCVETQPAYEELNLLMLLCQKRGDIREGRRYFKYYPPKEREKFLEGRFDGKYMVN
ncbi:MAG: O-antigen ligase family protein [Synergistaceae bacterium]|jgi:O-antigen ligase|nr:O-antigen ligase family protein [Synergistaceae bacterium]